MTTDDMDANPAVGWAWAGALALVTVAGTLAASCMMPFVALAVMAAATLPLRQALAATALAWAAEQSLGFGLLGYPLEASAIGWGIALGMAALAVTQASIAIGAERGIAPTIIAFAAGFVLYEVVLFVYGAAIGGTQAFTGAIVLQLARNELAWFAALLVLREALRLLLPTRMVPHGAIA
ncbi:hypothetical protein ACSBM8_01900 [Sphingomonas sp. ASY06-1R]|jgi:hypothetical protein|uniref:hypothetical protein n=1 Tax=Sphingomonas sp. ASY06-1R TaxID=3445771 RepID=UPI003FA2C784